MNGKERFRRALARQPVDRVPIGLVGIDYDTAQKVLGHETYWRAKVKSQIAFWEGRRDEVVQSWIEDGIELHTKLDMLDVVRVGGPASGLVPPRGYEPERVHRLDGGAWEAADGRVWKTCEESNEIALVRDPRPRLPQPAPFVAPREPDPSVFEVVDAMIRALGDERYIIGPAGSEAGLVLEGGYTEDALIAYVEEPERMREVIEHATLAGAIEDRWHLRPGCDGVFWPMDFASNQGPLISPSLFRELCLPSIKRRVADVKARGITVVKHACGNNWALMDSFVEAGYDAYQGIQISAGMDMKALKLRYGDRIALWGGVTVESLVGGTPDDIRRETLAALAACAPGGGYVFGTSHSVAFGTRYENFMTMLEVFSDNAARATS
jgi:uroporphyrinogen-III decarboxylase